MVVPWQCHFGHHKQHMHTVCMLAAAMAVTKVLMHPSHFFTSFPATCQFSLAEPNPPPRLPKKTAPHRPLLYLSCPVSRLVSFLSIDFMVYHLLCAPCQKQNIAEFENSVKTEERVPTPAPAHHFLFHAAV